MTEKKRFTSDYNGDETLLTHFLEDGKPLTKQELMDLLNTLYEENEQLKHDATVLIYSNQEYRKENEQLKIENQGQSDTIDGLQEMMAHYNLEELE